MALSVSDRPVSILRESVHPLSGAKDDYDPLIELVGNARYVLLGEATHGTHEFYKARAQITKRLITEKGFSVIAWEADCQKVTRPDCKHRTKRRGTNMPEQQTLRRAERDRREGKSPTTQADEFVREEMHHIREGKHGARSTKQAIAIGLSKARRAGVKLSPPRRGTASARTRRQAQRAYAQGQRSRSRSPSTTRSRATLGALKREGHWSASR